MNYVSEELRVEDELRVEATMSQFELLEDNSTNPYLLKGRRELNDPHLLKGRWEMNGEHAIDVPENSKQEVSTGEQHIHSIR